MEKENTDTYEMLSMKNLTILETIQKQYLAKNLPAKSNKGLD
jgi:hypothetical protein